MMRVLNHKPTFIDKLLGKQNINDDSQYRRLQFLELCEKDGVFLAYNMLTRKLAELTDKEYKLLSSDGFLYSDDYHDIITDWFAVPVDNDDIKLYHQSVALYNIFDNEKYINSYTILTTTDCNAHCFYCYEKGIKHINMSEKIAHDVAKFIISNSKDKKVELGWFGGEPLYNYEVINIITDDLRKANKTFTSSMISNGYLFNDNLVKLAKELWNLKYVQITLDGTQDIYNKCKNYIYDDPNPFKTVCNNIERLLKNNIAVKIRLNLDTHNYNDLYSLVDYIVKRFKGQKKLFGYVSLLYDLNHKRTEQEKQMLIENLVNIENKLYDSGILKGDLNNKFKVTCCMADDKHSTLINPEGGLARCEHYVNDYLWGTIYEPQYASSAFGDWKSINKHTTACVSCPYYIECLSPEKCIVDMSVCDCFDRELRSIRMRRTMHATFKKLTANEAAENNIGDTSNDSNTSDDSVC